MLTIQSCMEEATMTRRTIRFVIPLAHALLVALLAIAAQPRGTVYRIGFLSTDPV
jgi:hypothetical protein